MDRSKLKLTLKFIISIGLISVLLSKTDLEGVIAAAGQVDVRLFFFALAFSAVTIFIKSYKWHLLLGIQDAKLSIYRIQAITYMSIFFNNFFLGSIGGDAFKIYKTFSYPKAKSGAVSSIVMDRITGIPMLFFTVLCSGLLNMIFGKIVITWEQLLAVVIIGFVISLSILAFAFFFLKMGNLELSFLRFPRIFSALVDLKNSLVIHKNHKKTVFGCLILSFGFYMTNSIMVYWFAQSANVEISLLHLMFIVPFVLFLAMIPISLNGIGLIEGTYYYYYEKIGVEPSAALLIALLPRIGMLLFSLFGAFLYVLDGAKNKEPLMKSSSQEKVP